MIDQDKPLRKGDIVQNIFAGESSPGRFLMFLRKGTIRQGRYSHKSYDCLAYDGQKTQLFRDNEPLIYVGHMDEYDSFIAALSRLKDYGAKEDTP